MVRRLRDALLIGLGQAVFQRIIPLGCVRFENLHAWNGMVPFQYHGMVSYPCSVRKKRGTEWFRASVRFWKKRGTECDFGQLTSLMLMVNIPPP
jgi:hypothetical protein